MKRILRLPSLLRLTVLFLIALVFQNCSEQKIKESTDETLNITEYLRANPNYSMFLEMLDITNYASFMNTYGTYTVFVPTNEAVKEFLNNEGVSSLSEIPITDLQDLVKLHILDQKILTTSFTDGKIATPSLYGQYLVTGAASVNSGKMTSAHLAAKVSETSPTTTGTASVTVNKTANIVASNIVLGNGVVHVIDEVLRVANKTLAQTIEEDPNLSLFTEVLKATGWYDELNKPLTTDSNNIKSYLSVLAQTNEVFDHTKWYDPVLKDSIVLNTLENLKRRYSHLGDPKKLNDSLNLFVSYRLLPGLQYLADIAVSPALVTKAPLEVISAKLSKDTILLNQDVFNGVLEKGVAIDRNLSDVTASNGVLHYVKGNFSIKKRVPTPVYFEFTDIAEFRRLTGFYKKPGAAYQKLFRDDAGIDVNWHLKTSSDSNGYISYNKDADGTAINKGIGGCWGADALGIYRFRDANTQDVEFKTPVIIKGRYKIWISYRQKGAKLGNMKVFFDDIEMPRQVNLMEGGNMDSGTSEEVLESQGYKRYTYPFYKTVNCRLVGIIDVEVTGRHTLRLQSQGSFSDEAWLDIAEFRPVTMNQLWPKFAAGKNTLVQQP